MLNEVCSISLKHFLLGRVKKILLKFAKLNIVHFICIVILIQWQFQIEKQERKRI